MILEVAILNVCGGAGDAFEAAFREASFIIAVMPSSLSHKPRHCIGTPNRYIPLVHWGASKTTRSASGSQPSISDGVRCFTTSTTLFRPWSTTASRL